MKIVIIGSGVAGINASKKLLENGIPGKDILIIDKGKDPYNRKPSEIMEGFAGAGGFSDGKLTYHHEIGGQLEKYVGREEAYKLMDETIHNWKIFHPDPKKIMFSNPDNEPDFIKPYFGLRLNPTYHIGTDYLHEIGKNWYNYLVGNGVKFMWEVEIEKVDFKQQVVYKDAGEKWELIYFDHLIVATGKSGIDFSQKLMDTYKLKKEPKSVQIGVRFEAPQKHFQKLVDISYDFKLYRKYKDKGVSLRSFCTNNNAAYVAPEFTYGDFSYNGHAKKGEKFKNGMTNFGILMEIQGIEDPFGWSRNLVNSIQIDNKGLYYSPSRQPSSTSEGEEIPVKQISLDTLAHKIVPQFEGYFDYVMDFITDLKKVFPTLNNDWGIYIPEVKYLSDEPLVNYEDLSLVDFPNIYFVGDSLSARGITVSGAQGLLAAKGIIKKIK